VDKDFNFNDAKPIKNIPPKSNQFSYILQTNSKMRM